MLYTDLSYTSDFYIVDLIVRNHLMPVFSTAAVLSWLCVYHWWDADEIQVRQWLDLCWHTHSCCWSTDWQGEGALEALELSSSRDLGLLLSAFLSLLTRWSAARMNADSHNQRALIKLFDREKGYRQLQPKSSGAPDSVALSPCWSHQCQPDIWEGCCLV